MVIGIFRNIGVMHTEMLSYPHVQVKVNSVTLNENFQEVEYQ